MEEERSQAFTPIVTFILLGIIVLIFFIEIIVGDENDVDTILKLGGAYTPYILEKHEYYRLFTAMFLHFGINHLVSNCIALIAMGQYVEAYFGRVRYTIIYVLSGLAGSLLSVASDILSGNYPVAAGASGAICGLLGAMIILAIDKRTRRAFPLPRIIFALVMVLLPGFGKSNIAVYAHLGGLIGGFIIALIMYLISFRGADIYMEDNL